MLKAYTVNKVVNFINNIRQQKANKGMKLEHFIGSFFFHEQELFLMQDEVLEDVMIPLAFA